MYAVFYWVTIKDYDFLQIGRYEYNSSFLSLLWRSRILANCSSLELSFDVILIKWVWSVLIIQTEHRNRVENRHSNHEDLVKSLDWPLWSLFRPMIQDQIIRGRISTDTVQVMLTSLYHFLSIYCYPSIAPLFHKWEL